MWRRVLWAKILESKIGGIVMVWCLCDECPKKDCKNRRKLVVMPENGSCFNPFYSYRRK